MAADLGAAMNEKFNATGLVYVRNTGLTDLNELRQVARLVMKKEQPYKGGSNKRWQLVSWFIEKRLNRVFMIVQVSLKDEAT